jgi:protein O-GlcNAc transferase
MPPPCSLPLENCGETSSDPFDNAVMDLLRRGNLAQAEIMVRIRIAKSGSSAKSSNFLGWIAAIVGLPEQAFNYFTQAAQAAPSWRLPLVNLELLLKFYAEQPAVPARRPNRFLLIKAWGFGFWSDVAHVAGQLLLAELTGRAPIVHWGSNSLFADGIAANAFDAYFEPVSQARVDDLLDGSLEIWPPKWNHANLLDGALNQWKGPFSRIPGLYLLGRDEEIVVSDFSTSILDLQPWIPRDSPLYGKSLDELHAHFLKKYLRPRSGIIDAVDAFHARHFGHEEYLAVHVRGSDKSLEFQSLDALNQEYRRVIDEFRARLNLRRIFLMTDDLQLWDLFSSWYRGDIVSTECRRTATAEGIHYQAAQDRRQLGTEVMIDTYLALRGKAFIGNGTSNPSLMARYLKSWAEGTTRLIGPNLAHQPNVILHKW